MNIEFDSKQDRELFEILLDTFVGMTEMEPDEVEFINKVYKCIRKRVD